jgi:hypothetical protein
LIFNLRAAAGLRWCDDDRRAVALLRLDATSVIPTTGEAQGAPAEGA